jgi:hypothetical protein
MTEGREHTPHNADAPPPRNAPAAEKQPTGLPRSAGRRRLIKAGLAATPLLVTLRARPVYAQASLGSLGINYGLYLQDGAPGIENPDFDPSAEGGPASEPIIADPNGPDRRPDTGDEP